MDDRKFIIGLKAPTVSKTCAGCRKIYKLIDAGNDGIWTCPVCKKEIEWGT